MLMSRNSKAKSADEDTLCPIDKFPVVGMTDIYSTMVIFNFAF